MPPAGFEPTASGLGILRSIHLSYGGTRNISYLQLYVSPFVSICANLCLMLSDAKLEEYLNNAHIIKPSFKNKVEEYAAAVERTDSRRGVSADRFFDGDKSDVRSNQL